jgi:aminoglycoside phosphotransferase (APT) family kinase protein
MKLDGLPAIRHRQALMHGDLHAENVRVRNGQAILIDFAAVAQGPLVADPAGLESAICLTASAPDHATWRRCVEELYEPGSLSRLPQTRLPGTALAALCDVVRQIRRYGLSEQLSTHEYATAVAISLLRHAYRLSVSGEDPERRPVLFAIAERIARAL